MLIVVIMLGVFLGIALFKNFGGILNVAIVLIAIVALFSLLPNSGTAERPHDQHSGK
jgi:hypothetical protein